MSEKQNNAHPLWMDDELVSDISPKKLEFLSKMFQETRGKSQKELMQMMLPMLKQANKEHLTFTPQEMNAAIAAIKKYSTAEEREQMDKIIEKAKSGK